MTMPSIETALKADNPIELLEQIAIENEWLFDRSNEEEMNLSFPGRWGDYHLTLTWREDIDTLHVTAALELRVPGPRVNEIHALLALMNEQLWIGHFDLWTEEGQILFRYGLLLSGTDGATPAQCQGIVHIAVDACDRFFPAFQYVIWAGKTAREAMEVALFETVGTA